MELGINYRAELKKKLQIFFVDPAWTLHAHQTCSITALLSWAGEKKHNEKLMGKGQGEISH